MKLNEDDLSLMRFLCRLGVDSLALLDYEEQAISETDGAELIYRTEELLKKLESGHLFVSED